MSALLVQTSITLASPTVITIAGEIDIATAPALRHHLVSAPDRHTILDFSEVRLLSAAGLTELVDLRDRLTRGGVRLALAGASPSVRQVLTVTRLDDTMMLADTLRDAVQLMTDPIRRGPRPLSPVSELPPCGTPAPPAADVSTLAHLTAERRGQDGSW